MPKKLGFSLVDAIACTALVLPIHSGTGIGEVRAPFRQALGPEIGKRIFRYDTVGSGAAAAFTEITDLTTHEVTARLNWHFDLFGIAPAVAHPRL